MKMSPHEQTAAFAALSESLDRHSRRRLREALEVPTTDELSQQDLFALARAEIQALSDAEKRRAHERKEQGGDTKGGVKGVKLFVQDTATMGAYNFEVDRDFRPFLRALPSMCALIASGHKPKVRHALTGLGCGSFGCGC